MQVREMPWREESRLLVARLPTRKSSAHTWELLGTCVCSVRDCRAQHCGRVALRRRFPKKKDCERLRFVRATQSLSFQNVECAQPLCLQFDCDTARCLSAGAVLCAPGDAAASLPPRRHCRRRRRAQTVASQLIRNKAKREKRNI